MKAIILAAGRGQRLSPLTDTQPKCLVPYRGRPLIDHILSTLNSVGVAEIAVVTGYRSDVLEKHLASHKLAFFHNPKWETSNMLASLLTTRSWWDDDLILSYSDIAYHPAIVSLMSACPADICIPIDREWQNLWRLRMTDPLSDAETLVLDQADKVIEIGNKPSSYDQIQGQYMGLIGLKKNFLPRFSAYLEELSEQGHDLSRAHMTWLLDRLTRELTPVQALPVSGGWLEIDTLSDLAAYEAYERGGHDLCKDPTLSGK